MLPLLLVDVDGVLSLWGFSPDRRPEGIWTTVDGLPHLLSKQAAGHLRAVAGRFEARWCTGWEERADEHLPSLLGLGPWGHLSFARPERGSLPGHWKLAAIEAAAGDRPLAWIDDAFNDACWAWAAARAAPTLLVPTDPSTGVTAQDATRLAAFADGLSQTSGPTGAQDPVDG